MFHRVHIFIKDYYGPWIGANSHDLDSIETSKEVKKKTKARLKQALINFKNVIGGDPRQTLRERQKRALKTVRRATFFGS